MSSSRCTTCKLFASEEITSFYRFALKVPLFLVSPAATTYASLTTELISAALVWRM